MTNRTKYTHFTALDDPEIAMALLNGDNVTVQMAGRIFEVKIKMSIGTTPFLWAIAFGDIYQPKFERIAKENYYGAFLNRDCPEVNSFLALANEWFESFTS